MGRWLGAVVAVVVLAGGCSDASGTRDAAAPADASSASPTAECTVEGFAPRTAVAVATSRRRLVAAATVSLAPRSSRRSPAFLMTRLVDFGGKVRTAQGRAAPETTRRAVLAEAGRPLGRADILPLRLRNGTTRNRAYVLYTSALQVTGTWRHRGCVGNEVTTTRGTFNAWRRPRQATTACDVPLPGEPPSIRRQLARLCR